MGYNRCQFWTLGPRQGVPCIGFPYKSGRALCIFLVQARSTTLCKLVKPLRSQFVFMLPSSKVDKLKSRRKLPPPPDPRHDSGAKIGGFATNARYFFFGGGAAVVVWWDLRHMVLDSNWTCLPPQSSLRGVEVSSKTKSYKQDFWTSGTRTGQCK